MGQVPAQTNLQGGAGNEKAIVAKAVRMARSISVLRDMVGASIPLGGPDSYKRTYPVE